MKAVFVLFDSLNRLAIGPYGGAVAAPNFDRFARRAVTCDSHYVGSLPCMPARRDLHASRLNFMHRSRGPLEPFDNSMPEILKDDGVYTHLVSDHLHYFEDGGATYHTRFRSFEFIRGQEYDPWKAMVEPPIERLKEIYAKKHYDFEAANDPAQRSWARLQHAINREFMKDEVDFPGPRCFHAAFEFLDRNRRAGRWFLAALSAQAPAAGSRPVPGPGGGAPEAERRQLTVMFVDLVGSTALAARLDPEETRDIIRDYQDAVAGAVARFGGHVAKFIGDGVLCYFGWPAAHEDAAERAVHAGLAIAAACEKLPIAAAERLAARIGIATGLVVGDLVGSEEARERTLIGETPNLAARLQSSARPGQVVIAEGTRRLVSGLFEVEDLGRQWLKGFGEPVRVHRVIRPGGAAGRFEALHGTLLTPMVGREQELALLLDRWHRAKAGEGQVVLLSGEAGIGKSRLALALRERLRTEPGARLRYYGSPYHTNSTLWPVINQLERAAGLNRDEPGAAKLARLEALLDEVVADVTAFAPVLAELLAIPTGGRYPPIELSPQQRKAGTFAALLAYLQDLARRQGPVLMVLEDAHWIDPTTRELFELVTERIQRLPALLVVTCRPEFEPAWTGRSQVTTLTLNRLGHGQAAAIIERTAGKALPAEVASAIVNRTDGVPLFVEELTKAVLESGLLSDAGDRFELSGTLPPLAIPATLHDSLMARLDRLAPIKEVAQIGAVIGREFSHELLVEVADRPEHRLRVALDELVQSELIFRQGTPPQASYSFKHALVRDVAYQSLLKSRRQQLHGRIARSLKEQFSHAAEAQPELLARHSTEAGLFDKAVDYWYRAGRLASERSALTEAIGHFGKALELVTRHRRGAAPLG